MTNDLFQNQLHNMATIFLMPWENNHPVVNFPGAELTPLLFGK